MNAYNADPMENPSKDFVTCQAKDFERTSKSLLLVLALIFCQVVSFEEAPPRQHFMYGYIFVNVWV